MKWNRKCSYVEYEISYHQNIMIQINQNHCIKLNTMVAYNDMYVCLWPETFDPCSDSPKRAQSQFSKLKIKKRLLQIYYTTHITFFVVVLALANLHFCCMNMDIGHDHCSCMCVCMFIRVDSLCVCHFHIFNAFFCTFSLFIHNSQHSNRTHTFVYAMFAWRREKKPFPNESLGKQMRAQPFYRI